MQRMVHEGLSVRGCVDSKARHAFTQSERERVACRAGFVWNTLQLRVYTQEINEPPVMVGLVTIRNNRATYRDITSNGGLTPPVFVPCNGSVSKDDMRKAVGCGKGVKLFAKVLTWNDLGYRKRDIKVSDRDIRLAMNNR